jgi:hypothetical protein
MGWVVSVTPRPLNPQERPGTHCTGGWVGPRAGLDRRGTSRPNRDSIPGPSSPYRVAIPTEPSRSIIVTILKQLIRRNLCLQDTCDAVEANLPLRSRMCIRVLGIRQGHSCTHGWSRVGCDLLVFQIHSFIISRGTMAQNKLPGVMYGRNRPKQFIMSDTKGGNNTGAAISKVHSSIPQSPAILLRF